MLSKLTVSNFALIENAVLEFDKGFTVITGETGSGKSILLGALKLILGERADYNVIRDDSKKTTVEAVFDIHRLGVASFFEHHDLDFAEETIVRREINANGKSRAFINDSPVQLAILKEFTDKLIHIHSQHNTINLKSKAFQLELLDVLGGGEELKNKVRDVYRSWKAVEKQLNEARETQAKYEREVDFNAFLLEELKELQLTSVDYEALEVELKRIEQFEELKAAFSAISEVINGDEGVSSLLANLKRVAKLDDKSLEELVQRIDSMRIELDDIALSASRELSNMEASEADLATMTSQIDQFNSLLRKHNCSSQAELIILFNELEQKIQNDSINKEQIIELEHKLSKLSTELTKVADELSKKRQEVAPNIEKAIVLKLNDLKLNDSKLKFALEEKEVGENGKDGIQLLFTPNKGMSPQPIERSASGGELARVMLVIHYMLSTKKSLPTVIFDEIDTGVSGEVAQRIGYLLKEMGGFMQLFAITHLPQVAASGESQIRVSKNDNKGETVTHFEKLTADDRVYEVAKLMSGEEVNQAAIDNAKKLLKL